MIGTWRCPRCGDANQLIYDVCYNCGTRRDGREDPNFSPEGLGRDGRRIVPRRILRLARTKTVWLTGVLAIGWVIGLYTQGHNGWAILLACGMIVAWLITRRLRLSLMKQDLLDELASYGQQHLLEFWDKLGPGEQQQLADEIRSIDFALVRQLHQSGPAGEDWRALAARAESPPAFRLSGEKEFTPRQARQRGEDALRAGQVGALLVAGGQGTRLGFDHPKGMFPIGPVSKASLFQILLEKLLAARSRYGADIPLYIMTSPATDEQTRDYLERHDYFGLPEQDVHLFCQGVMPAVDARSGRLLLSEPGRLALSPDGHGGMLAALATSGGLSDLERRGIEQLYYFQVDNPLVTVCDPEFLGYHLLSNAEMSTQVVAKRTPRDNVGNVVQIDGRVRILEYSDLNPLEDEIVLRKSGDGTPVFWAGNIGVHAISVAFLNRMAAAKDSLPFHVARKKAPHIDEHGQLVEPDEPNAMKFERFIFDLLPAARRSIVMEVDEAAVFAPLKNAPGAERDSPETVQAQMMTLYRGWLKAAGAKLDEGVPIEISPLLALDAEELKARLPANTRIQEPTLLALDN